MDRAERAGFGIALVGHVALIAAVSLGMMQSKPVPPPISPPLDVELVRDTALQSAAPQPAPPEAAAEPPAPAPTEPLPPEPAKVAPAKPAPPPPIVKPTPKPAPIKPAVVKAVPVKPAAKPVPKPPVKPASPPAKPAVKPATKAATKPVATAAAKPPRASHLSRAMLDGLNDQPAAPRTPAKTPPATGPTGVTAAQMTGAQKNSLNQLINAQLKPFWKPPSGADADQLVTILSVRLNADGSLAAAPEVDSQQGITDSNRSQARLHAERAIQAVRRAVPFHLPAEYRDAWQWIKPRFDGKMNR